MPIQVIPHGAGQSTVGVEGDLSLPPGQSDLVVEKDDVVVNAAMSRAHDPLGLFTAALVHRSRMGLQQAAQVGVEVCGALLGPGQDDVARRADARQDVQSGNAGGAGPDVIG